MTASQAPSTEGPWNPGLRSDIPQSLWPLVTLFVEENAFVSHAEAAELSDLTGLTVLELYSLRPQRLVTHALLVRVTADLTVPDGPSYAELGINLRSMVKSLYENHVQDRMPSIETAFEQKRQEALDFISARLEKGFAVQSPQHEQSPGKVSLWARWFGQSSARQPTVKSVEISEFSVIDGWKKELAGADSVLEKTCLEDLIKVVSSIVSHRGRMLPDHSLVGRIVANKVMNTLGATAVDTVLDSLWADAVAAEGFRTLPAQPKPVVMNVKGASASGKSTIRPQQRRLAEKLGIDWEDFALISPDYWRKYLVDYSTLGEHYKYGAMLTGRELEIVDKKLDNYMAAKASAGIMSHLLIDRFRFDSFIVDIDRAADSKLLSRFGDRVFLFFMVTHPAETVVRAWHRGNTTGRYKAVDDLLYHNVEAFTGMPDLFLSWVNSKDKHIHFEFLDNDVPEGDLPRTAAYGRNNLLCVLDIRLLLNIERYRRVNIHACKPDDIFNSSDNDASVNTGFIERCANHVACIVFADQKTLQQYAIVRDGDLVWWDDNYIKDHASSEGLTEALGVLGYDGNACPTPLDDHIKQPADVDSDTEVEKFLLVGHLSDGTAASDG